VLIEGDGLSLVSWNHRPALVRTALRRSGGIAQWKPRWQLLVVPTGDLADGARNVFSVVAPDERRKCSVTRSPNPDHLIPSKPSPMNVPALRIAARYAAGRPRAPRCARHSHWVPALALRYHTQLNRVVHYAIRIGLADIGSAKS
jgi:hypothetical protein